MRTCPSCDRHHTDATHRYCSRCRQRRQPGPRAVKTRCPVCGSKKTNRAKACVRCWNYAIDTALRGLNERIRNARPIRLPY